MLYEVDLHASMDFLLLFFKAHKLTSKLPSNLSNTLECSYLSPVLFQNGYSFVIFCI